jgi:membrane-bound serine protease (ClpP class)
LLVLKLAKNAPSMKNIKISGFLVSVVIAFIAINLHASESADPFADKSKVYKVYTFNIKEMIAPPVWHLAKKAFEAAGDTAADLVIIHMNTYGGMLESADSIRTAILQSPVPVWVFIDNNAASAGALISIACDSIYMRPGANIGAATVVDQSGEVVPDKYQSYMRSMMRSTAEAKGRDPRIAEGMVDPRIKIPGVSDSGQVITFTTTEAIKFGFCEGKAESIEDVLKVAGIEQYEIIKHQLTWTDKIIRFFVNPYVSGILIMVIIGGLYFELQTPGIGFPIAASVLAALLYFAPLYIEGLATHWEILLFIVGIILIAVELFVIPGFGVTGIAGVVLVILGLALGMVDLQGFKYGDFPFGELTMALFIVIIATFSSLTLSFWISKKLFTTSRFGELALSAVQNSSEGYTSALSAYTQMIGSEGITKTDLRPSGKIMIDSETYDASAESGYIEKGEHVKVIRYVNAQLFVRKSS